MTDNTDPVLKIREKKKQQQVLSESQFIDRFLELLELAMLF
jgi:hypothetical protein